MTPAERGTPPIFHMKVCEQVLGNPAAYVKTESKLCEAFYGSRGSCVKCNTLPQVMSPESVSTVTKDV